MATLNELFESVINNEPKDALNRQFDATFQFNGNQARRRNTISGSLSDYQTQHAFLRRLQQQSRKSSSKAKKFYDNSKIPFRPLIREALESTPQCSMTFWEIMRWMQGNMPELDNDDLQEMFKWQRGIKRVLENDPTFVQDGDKRWTFRSSRESRDDGFCSRNNSMDIGEEYSPILPKKRRQMATYSKPPPNRILSTAIPSSIEMYRARMNYRDEMDLMQRHAPTVADLLMIRPNHQQKMVKPVQAVQASVPAVQAAGAATIPQPQFSLDQLTLDFLAAKSTPQTTNTTTNDEPTISEDQDVIAEFLNEPFIHPSNGDKYLPIDDVQF